MSKYLDVQNRPLNLQKEIDSIFHQVIKKEYDWPLNGSPIYELCLIPETYILLNLILNSIYSQPNKKIFNILDIGAGNFLFIKTLANFIDIKVNSGVLPEDIKLNIIGVRGEANTSSMYLETKNSTIHMVGGFACENLISELRKNGFDNLIGKFQAIITQWTLIHLVDPLGEIVQMYNCLDNEGVMIYDNHSNYHIVSNNNVKNFTASEFGEMLINYFHLRGNKVLAFLNLNSSTPVSIIQKIGNDTLNLPFEYHSDQDYFNYKALKMISTTKEFDANKLNLTNYFKIDYKNDFMGDKSLFNLILEALILQIEDNLLNANESLDLLNYVNKEYEQVSSSFCYGRRINSPLPLGDQYYSTNRENLIDEIKYQLAGIKDYYRQNTEYFEYRKNYVSNNEIKFYELDFESFNNANSTTELIANILDTEICE